MKHSKYRHQLPQSADRIFLTDGGLETTLIFHEGVDLPCFAAFDLLKDDAGRETLAGYYTRYIDLAKQQGCGFVFETPTWRANPDWAAQLGYSDAALAAANAAAVCFARRIRDAHETAETPIVISGNIGPRGDGYVVGEQMTAEAAERYHAAQISVFAEAGVDMIAFVTATYVEEAIGIARASKKAGLPCAISFTVETDGRLPSGQSLAEAIRVTDRETDAAPAYYMINCAHPDHFSATLAEDPAAFARIRGIRANASRMSHAELDAAESLDDGDPHELGAQYEELRRMFPQVTVLGGCCGTDHRHVEAIGHRCCGASARAA